MPLDIDLPPRRSEPPLVLIAAMTPDRVIGRQDGLPWDLPDEYAHFRSCIHGQAVIMGRRSWEIFGSDLTSQLNVVASRSAEQLPGAVVARSIDEALAVTARCDGIVFSAGGATVYAATLPRADALWLSIVHNRVAGDTYFPEIDADTWGEVRRERHDGWDFVVFHRRRENQHPSTTSGTGE
jgi:dihydrofolate reductase